MSVYDLAFYICLGLIIGLAAGSLFPFAFAPLILLIILISLSFLLLLSIIESSRSLFIIFFCLLIIFPAYGYSLWRCQLSENYLPNPGNYENLVGTISASPSLGQNYQLLKVTLSSPYHGEVLVYTDIFADWHYGDLIFLSGHLQKSLSGRLFLSWPEIKIANRNDKFIFSNLFALKANFLEKYHSVLPNAPAALLSGLTLGERSGFSSEFKEAMSKSGTTHLVALSGYNITIIAAAVALLFNSFFSRRFTFFLSVGAIILFVLMVGPEPSIVRAAIMGTIALLALVAGRFYSPRNAIAVSAAAMLIITPSAAADIGFQLSFAALLGLVYLLPALKVFFRLEESTSLFNWRNHLLTTASAQLMALPLILYYFHYFSPWSLLANVLILESVPYAMLLGFLIGLFGICGSIFFLIPFLLSYPVLLILNYQIFVINFFARFNFLALGFTPSLFLVIIYYTIAILFIRRWLFPKPLPA